jgi:hypothetical protein
MTWVGLDPTNCNHSYIRLVVPRGLIMIGPIMEVFYISHPLWFTWL